MAWCDRFFCFCFCVSFYGSAGAGLEAGGLYLYPRAVKVKVTRSSHHSSAQKPTLSSSQRLRPAPIRHHARGLFGDCLLLGLSLASFREVLRAAKHMTKQGSVCVCGQVKPIVCTRRHTKAFQLESSRRHEGSSASWERCEQNFHFFLLEIAAVVAYSACLSPSSDAGPNHLDVVIAIVHGCGR